MNFEFKVTMHLKSDSFQTKLKKTTNLFAMMNFSLFLPHIMSSSFCIQLQKFDKICLAFDDLVKKTFIL